MTCRTYKADNLSLISVSYTHLDVYKRQHPDGEAEPSYLPAQWSFHISYECSVFLSVPWQSKCRDVYKRQLQNRLYHIYKPYNQKDLHMYLPDRQQCTEQQQDKQLSLIHI